MSSDTFFLTALNDVKLIETKTIDLFQLNDDATRLHQEIVGYEATIYDEVCAESDSSTLKPVYTNDGARKAAAAKRQLDHKPLQGAKQQLREKNIEIARVNASIASLREAVSLRRAFLHGGNFAERFQTDQEGR